MGAPTLFELVRLLIGGGLIAIGLGFSFGAAIGLLRFPDFYTRVHAATVATGVAAIAIVAGLALSAPDLGLAVRLGLLGALIAAMNPTLAHIVVSAAHAGGLAPLAGPYTAPRPGASGGKAARR